MPDPPPAPAPAQAKQTSNRRRRPNRKNYASENDVAKADPGFQPDFVPRNKKNGGGGGGGPSTPQKAQKNGMPSKSPAPGTQAASGKAGNNRNNRNQQNNNNNNPTSPPAKAGRRTPPQTAGPKPIGATASVAAFAGATFHASPAPSSLPVPSFFTKTNSPGTPSARPLSGLSQQPSPPASDTEVPSSTATKPVGASSAGGRNPLFPTGGVSIPPPRDESPLDLLFRADRAEKERNRRASSANLYGAPVGPFSPPLQSQSMADNANSNTFPRDFAQQQQQQQSTRRPGPTLRTSSSGISAAELDGTPGQPMGPAFATPFQDRIRAARPVEAKGTSGAGAPSGFRDLAAGSAPSPFAGGPYNQQPPPPAANIDDRSEALKRYLFSKTAGSTAGSTASPSAHPTASAPTTPTRYPGPPGAVQQPPMYGGTPYQNKYSMSPANGTPNHHQGYPNGQPQATPNRPHGGNNGGSSNIAAMEDSLRQILKLGSPFGNGAPSPGLSRQA
ncbi:hypothetical protein Sste5346_008655 [Sporothrix stenoceras]|uniref:Proteophosphoglycan 5 n=1 Tax=Sporothrix stenoceras TaxID=5173 RepID=A0ABR3YPD1_9PEZI